MTRAGGAAARELTATEESAPLLRVEDVSKTYRSGGGETPVLHEVSLELAQGETTSLVGASGSGKSTLISLIAGLLMPDSGRIAFEGLDLRALDDVEMARLRARRIGVVLQSGNLIPFLSARENVELAIDLAGGRGAAARARELLGEVGVVHRMDHRPHQLSGGEVQRVSLAVALANEPDLLLADEVTGELDSATAEHVANLVFEASRERGLTVLFVTHSAELAARAERHLEIVKGGVREA